MLFPRRRAELRPDVFSTNHGPRVLGFSSIIIRNYRKLRNAPGPQLDARRSRRPAARPDLPGRADARNLPGRSAQRGAAADLAHAAARSGEGALRRRPGAPRAAPRLVRERGDGPGPR